MAMVNIPLVSAIVVRNHMKSPLDWSQTNAGWRISDEKTSGLSNQCHHAKPRSWMRASEWKSFMMAMTMSRRLPHNVSICGGGYGYAKVTMAFNT